MTSAFKMFQALLLTLLTLMLRCEAADSTPTCSSQQLPVTNIINSFSFHLEQLLDIRGNYFFSPLSISLALAMVYIGARGTTREQMAEALEYDVVGKNCLPNKISENFRELIRSLQSEKEEYKFLIASGAFMQKNYPISHYYSSSLEKFFNSKVRFLDFADEEEIAMRKINEWVANYTQGKISEVVSDPLDRTTIMVLMNAVYFKGLWDIPFPVEDTRDGTFHKINNSRKTVKFMMTRNKFYNYYDAEKEYSIIELEYLGGNVSMIVILPKDRNVFPRYELTNDILCNLRSKFQYTEVFVRLPKFKLEFQRELSMDMIKMGMDELFSDNANLSGISEQNDDIHVSKMIHKAVIEVNEKGSEASAFAGVVIDGRIKATKQDTFEADHPFLFYIIHRETNTILFSGRVMEP